MPTTPAYPAGIQVAFPYFIQRFLRYFKNSLHVITEFPFLNIMTDIDDLFIKLKGILLVVPFYISH
jgi:hypothetical protein